MAAAGTLTNPNQDAMDDLEKKFAPGEAVAKASYTGGKREKQGYGKKMEKIPKKYQDEALAIAQRIQAKDLFARLDEVKRAADGGFYWRNIFDAYWSDTNFEWGQAGGPGGDGNDNDASLTYPLPIYQSEGRAFIKIVGHKPEVHFTASGDAPTAFRVADGCDVLMKQIEETNKDSMLEQDFARIAFTDGRYGIYTRWMADGARFGYYDDDQDEYEDAEEGVGGGSTPPEKKPRQPKGGVVQSIYGVPWLKVPINMENIHFFTWLSLSFEVDASAAKAMYPWIAKLIAAGTPGPSEFMFDRTTRIALTQGLHLVSQMAEAFDQLPTLNMLWLRPSHFAEIEDEECRSFFLDNYPDGAKFVFVGNNYAESCNESMDAHWSIGHAVRGHGQATPPYGYGCLTVQDALCDEFDLEMETHMRALRAWYGDPTIFDFNAMNKQVSNPGGRWPLKKDIGTDVNVNNKMVVEPEVQVSAQLIALRESLLTTIPASVTGISSAAVGQSDENNPTLGGITILRAAGRGEAGTAYQGFVQAYCRSMEQGVKIAAKYLQAEADENGLLVVKQKGADAIIDLVEIREAKFWCESDSAQTYPSTFEEKQMSLTALTLAAQAGDPQAKAMLADPGNAQTFARLRGIGNVKSSVGSVGLRVQQKIEMLLAQPPQPIKQAILTVAAVGMAAQAQGQEAPPPDKYKLFKSSMEMSPMDNAELELPFFQEWLYSQTGWRTKFDNPQGHFNVELFAIMLQQKAQANAAQAAQQAIQGPLALEAAKKQPSKKSPAESINYKDAGPSVRLQMEAQAGLDGRADAADDMTKDQMGGAEAA